MLLFLFSFGLAYWLYLKGKTKHEVSKKVLGFLFLFRGVTLFLVGLLTLSLFLNYKKNNTVKPIILFALDDSKSMISARDSDEVRQFFYKPYGNLVQEVEKKYATTLLFFSSKTDVLKNKPSFNGKETDLSELINYIDNNYSGENIGALVLASDGIFNKGINPTYLTDKFNFPIYTIAVGDTIETSDLIVQKINHNQIAYKGNAFPIEVLVQAKRLKGKQVSVGLYNGNKLEASQLITITNSNFSSTCNFTLNAEKAGVVSYQIKTTVFEEEKNIANNQLGFAIDVLDNKEKILLLYNHAHPDIMAIKDVLENKSNYELEVLPADEFTGTLKSYSLLILHGYSAAQSKILSACKDNNIPFWIVNPEITEGLPGLKINSNLNRINETESFVDNTFTLFNISVELKRFIKEAPALKSFFGNYNAFNSSNLFIVQRLGDVETNNPTLLFTEINNLKTAVFIGDGLWRWKLRDYVEHENTNLFAELVGKTIQYLAAKSDKGYFKLKADKIISENENVEIIAEVYNKSYEPTIEPDVSFTLSNQDNKKFNYTFSKLNNSYKLDLGQLAVGNYTYRASVNYNGSNYTKEGSFLVQELLNEQQYTVANHSLLFGLGKNTGGKSYSLKQISELEKELMNNETIKSITYTQNNTLPIIEFKVLFFLILVFLSVEWFIRKRFFRI